MDYNYKLWIDGKWTDSKGGAETNIENPATGETVGTVLNATRADVDTAVQAAHNAFYDGRWSRLLPGERALAIWKLAELVEKNAESLARAESLMSTRVWKCGHRREGSHHLPRWLSLRIRRTILSPTHISTSCDR